MQNFNIKLTMCSTQGTAIMTTDEYAEYLEAGALAQTDFFFYCTLTPKKKKKKIRSCMGSVQFKVYVSTSNTKDLIQFVAINASSLLKSTLKCELIEPHNTLKKPFYYQNSQAAKEGWFGV